MLNYTIVLCFLIFLSCNIHFRNIDYCKLKLINISIINQNNSNKDLTNLLKYRLRLYGIHIYNFLGHSKYLLILQNSKYNKNIINRNSSLMITQYLLYYTILIKIIDHYGKTIVPWTKLTTSKILTINDYSVFIEYPLELKAISEMYLEMTEKIIHIILKLCL